MNIKFRIIKDSYAGFEVQAKRWWFPFWIQCDGTNTHLTLERAKEFIKNGCKEHPKIKTIIWRGYKKNLK